MPPATHYVPPTQKERFLGFLNNDTTERKARQDEFEQNERYYNGDMPEFLEIDENDRINDNVTLNITKEAVDRTLSFLFPHPIKFVIDPDTDDSPDELLLEQTFNANGGIVWLTSLAYNGALGGHNFVKILPPDPTLEENSEFARLIMLHPSQVVIYWNAADMMKILWYEVRWSVGDDSFIQDIVFDPDNGRWLTYEYVQKKGRVRWQLIREPSIWEGRLGPVVDGPHLPSPNKRYGKPDITKDLRKLNDGINRVASDISRILRYYASPRTIGTGIGAGDINTTEIGGFWTTANPNAQIKNLEMEGDLSSSMNFLQSLVDTLFTTTRVVVMKGNVKDFQRVTNTSIRAVFLDMIAKNQLLRWSYGNLLQKVARRVLMLAHGGDETFKPIIVWADPLPTDETEIVNIAAIKRSMAIVSRETTAKQFGYDWKTESQKMIDEEKLSFIKQSEKQASGANLTKSDQNEFPR